MNPAIRRNSFHTHLHMKQNNDLTNYIENAAELVHRAYFAQTIGLEALSDRLTIRPPEDVLLIEPDWLRKTKVSPARDRLFMSFVEIDMRHYLSREISSKAYALLRDKRWKKGASPLAIFSTQLVCKTREELCDVFKNDGVHNSLLQVVKNWRQWDNTELGGWLHDNIEKTIHEIDHLWSKIQLVALRVKNNGALSAVTLRELCADIFGAGLKGDREMDIVSRFHYEHQYYGLSFTTSINEGIPFVRFEECASPSSPIQSRDPSEIGNWLSKKLAHMSDGSDPGASAGRLLMLLHAGNYVAAGNRLCRVSLPIEPLRGIMADISNPKSIHPMIEDYTWCARTALRFFLAGFVWPTMRACGHDMKLVESVIEKFWIPKIYNTFFVVAHDKTPDSNCALLFSASIYARLLAIKSWLNPVQMRQKLKECFWETAVVLEQFKETASDLEQAIQCGLFRGPDDILALAGDVVDAGLRQDPRFATLILYQRDSCQLAVQSQHSVHS